MKYLHFNKQTKIMNIHCKNYWEVAIYQGSRLLTLGVILQEKMIKVFRG